MEVSWERSCSFLGDSWASVCALPPVGLLKGAGVREEAELGADWFLTDPGGGAYISAARCGAELLP